MRNLSLPSRLVASVGVLGMLVVAGCDRTPVSPDSPGASATVTTQPAPENPGTGTPGYWMNHPDAWPYSPITIGGVEYTKWEAIDWMGTPEKGDKTLTLFRALVAAKLNVSIGNDGTCIWPWISVSQGWMEDYGPVGSGVKASSDAWQMKGEDYYEKLDAYNNGELCAPSRDSLEE